MPGDDRSRPTRPPLNEDSPPAEYREFRGRPTLEPIAKIALRAPKVPEATGLQEEVLRALAQTEGRVLTEISDRREEDDEVRRGFEERVRREIRALVAGEVAQSIPPPRSPEKKKFEWSQLQYVAALIVALTGLIAMILNSQKPSAEVLKRFDALDAAQEKTSQKLDAHIASEEKQRGLDREQDYKYALDVRSWVTDVLERAASVKIDDPPGTPKRDQLGFYPAPRIDSHKVTDTHIVQPRDPYPVPPPP